MFKDPGAASPRPPEHQGYEDVHRGAQRVVNDTVDLVHGVPVKATVKLVA